MSEKEIRERYFELKRDMDLAKYLSLKYKKGSLPMVEYIIYKELQNLESRNPYLTKEK